MGLNFKVGITAVKSSMLLCHLLQSLQEFQFSLSLSQLCLF